MKPPRPLNRELIEKIKDMIPLVDNFTKKPVSNKVIAQKLNISRDSVYAVRNGTYSMSRIERAEKKARNVAAIKRLVAEGKRNSEIAEELDLTPSYVGATQREMRL